MSGAASPPPQPAAAPPARPAYAVELYFDPALENQVLKAWNVLARRQISTHLIELASRPHITLLAGAALDPARLHTALRLLAARSDPLPLTLSSVAALPGLLFLAPSPSLALLQLHAQLCEALKKEGVEVEQGYRPDAWIPHCAVAQDVPRGRMGDAFQVMMDQKLPVSGYAMDIGLVEVGPVREIFSFPLGGGADA